MVIFFSEKQSAVKKFVVKRAENESYDIKV
jgi:hypothetical protein